MKESPVIVALDVADSAEARALVARLGDAASFYKVGLELYAAAGMDFVRELKEQGRRVFLDLKVYDIGETVRRTVARIAQSGVVDFLTVHGMRQVMRAAVAGRDGAALKLLAVSVLTSVDERDLREDGYSCTVAELIDLRVRNAGADGADGMICSACDLPMVRSLVPRAILVTPGVRSPGASAGDQKRVATPAEAIAGGADYIVVGRQVTRAADPREAMLGVLEEIRQQAHR